MEVINMLPGGVFIINKSKDEIMFKNSLMLEMDWVAEGGVHVKQEYRFKLVPIVKISENKADAVRLYENDVDEDDLQHTDDNARIVNFLGVLNEAE